MTQPELEKNIGTLVEKAAARYGDKKFLTIDHEGVSYSFNEFNFRINQFANALRQAGIRQEQHVGVMLPNCSAFPLTWLALAKLGAIMVPINNRCQVKDLEYVLGDSDATTLVIYSEYIPIYRKVSPKSHKVKQVFRLGEGEEDIGVSLEESAVGMSTDLTPAQPALDDVMNLQYTSGTTGFPKAAITTHEYWLMMGQSAAEMMTSEDVFLTMSPFYYMDPQWELLMCLYSGCSMVLMGKITLENFVRSVKKYPISCLWAFEEMLYIPDFEQYREHHLRFALLGGFPPTLHRQFEERFHVAAREVFGMTEIGLGTLMAKEDVHMVGSGSVGKPPAYRDLRIVDEQGKILPRGEVGELLVKGQGIFKGYYKKPAENAKAFFGEYFRTGDLFRQDENGYYYFVGRKKDMIRRMGDNISATEVEHVLTSHPKITEAAVVPVPDKTRGEEVKAYILPAPGETPESIPPQEVIAYCLERIAKFKVPRYIEYVTDFPRSASDKIQKNILTSQKEDLTEGCFDRFGEK